jgi:hypothetical protein
MLVTIIISITNLQSFYVTIALSVYWQLKCEEEVVIAKIMHWLLLQRPVFGEWGSILTYFSLPS